MYPCKYPIYRIFRLSAIYWVFIEINFHVNDFVYIQSQIFIVTKDVWFITLDMLLLSTLFLKKWFWNFTTQFHMVGKENAELFTMNVEVVK